MKRERRSGGASYQFRARLYDGTIIKKTRRSKLEAEKALAMIAQANDRRDPIDAIRVIADGHDGNVVKKGPTFRKAAEEYLKAAKRKLKASTYRTRSGRLAAIYDPKSGDRKAASWARKPIRNVTREEIIRWLNEREDGGITSSTRNKYVAAISCVFKWACRNKHLPWSAYPFVRGDDELRGKESTGREVYLTVEQIGKVAEAAREVDAEYEGFVLFAAYSGMRRGEMLAMEWRDVAQDCGSVALRAETTKTSKPRVVELLPEAVDVLKARKRARGDADGHARVFPWPVIRVVRRWRRTIALASDRAELPTELRFHDLRHTYATLLLNKGVDLKIVADLLGHTLIATTNRYAHLQAETKRAAIARVGRTLPATIAGPPLEVDVR